MGMLDTAGQFVLWTKSLGPCVCSLLYSPAEGAVSPMLEGPLAPLALWPLWSSGPLAPLARWPSGPRPSGPSGPLAFWPSEQTARLSAVSLAG